MPKTLKVRPPMPFPRAVIAPLAFAAAGGLAVLGAFWAANAVETRTAAAVNTLFLHEGMEWAQVETTGLQIRLSGTAPTEAQRLRVLNLAASLVDSGRLRDLIEVAPARAIAPPRFSVELLRNDDGISLIGLVPAAETEGGTPLAAEVAALTQGAPLADMLEQADYPAPPGWDRAVQFGLTALKMLPRAKISIAADGVQITAISASEDEKRRFETELARARPEGLAVVMDISAPRPVLTPFTLRFVRDAAGARFDACAADTERARDRIIAAAVAAGLAGKGDCTIGMGVPTPRWSEGAAVGIAALAALGQGTITFSDADVTLLAAVDTPQATFDRVVGELQAALPDVFSLNATLPPKPKAAAPEGPAEFTASLDAEGAVQLRGRLTDAALRDAVANFARARFGAEAVYIATRLDPDLPDGWPVRVLAGLESLADLTEGTLTVRPDTVAVAGVTGSQGAQARITRVLSDKLGQGQGFTVDIRYDERKDPLAALPTPDECVTELNAILAAQKITFDPGSAEIAAGARATMEALADTMRRCPDIPMEIAGHTDAQGSETGNQARSQARAEAVLLGLQGRRVLVSALTARGYGESVPIADNATEAGREANRRIAFTLRAPVSESDEAFAALAAYAAEINAQNPDGADDGGVTLTVRPAPKPVVLDPIDQAMAPLFGLPAPAVADEVAATEPPADQTALEVAGDGSVASDPAAAAAPPLPEAAATRPPAAPSPAVTVAAADPAVAAPGADTNAADVIAQATPDLGTTRAITLATGTGPVAEEPFVSAAPATATLRPQPRPAER